MDTITVNLPETYIKALDKLVGEHGLFPSRAEAVRLAVREFLIKEMNTAKDFKLLSPEMFRFDLVHPNEKIFSNTRQAK